MARRRIGLPHPATVALAAAVPAAAAGALGPSKWRSATVWALHMFSYKVLYDAPYDDRRKLKRRLRIDYPIRFDSLLGGGQPPSERLQRALRTPWRLSPLDKALSALYWSGTAEPHALLAWILLRHGERFPRAALRLAATYDLTLVGYWCLPTAPPWWASEKQARMRRRVRRVAVDVARAARGRRWRGRDHDLGDNPWASMPSDHFATAATAAMLAAEINRPAGAAAWTYAGLLGFALVYLGEHYVLEALACSAVAEAVRRFEPRAAALLECVSRRAGDASLRGPCDARAQS